jgi:hypothetical protein
MSDSKLPLAAVAVLLVSLFIAFGILASRYWRYLMARNATLPPAESRWTLALVDRRAQLNRPEFHTRPWKLDIDHRGLFTSSVRSKIECKTTEGKYLTLKEARRLIKQTNKPIVDYSVEKTGSHVSSGIFHLGLGSKWTLEPLVVVNNSDEVPIDLADLKPQVEIIAASLMSSTVLPEHGQVLLDSLTMQIAELAPGEAAAYDKGTWAPKVIRTLCCNKVTAPNVMKDFTSLSYTRGETIHRPGRCTHKSHKHLPLKVTKLSAFAGSLMLLATWAAFYPGIVLQKSQRNPNPVNCETSDVSSEEGLCTVDRIADETLRIKREVRRIVNIDAAVAQARETLSYQAKIESDVSMYLCPASVAGPNDFIVMGVYAIVDFPDWCSRRRQVEIAQRRTCCKDYTYSNPNMCGQVPATAYGVTVRVPVCMNQISGYSSTGVATGASQAGCARYSRPCPANGQVDVDAEQAQLTTYVEARAVRRHNNQLPLDAKVPTELASEDASKAAVNFFRTFKRRMEVASDYYIAYIILRLWIPSPLLVCSSPWHAAVRRNMFGLSKRMFVVVIITAWWAWDMLKYLKDFTGPNLRLYFVNIAEDPCFLDASFLHERTAAIGEVCATLHNVSMQVTESNRTILDMYADITAFAPPFPNGCGCAYPGNLTDIEDFIFRNSSMSGLREFVGNASFCSDKDRQLELLHPLPPTINWLEVWFKSGVVAGLVRPARAPFRYGSV